MAPGLTDRVDCARLAEDAAVLERVYPLSELPRLQDLLADARGSVRARFAFSKLEAGAGRTGATVAVQATARLVCQRCLQSFEMPLISDSEIEFASSDASSIETPREIYLMDEGSVSLRDLAEEELLLALPVIASCSKPETCGQAPSPERQRPFAVLQDLLKKT
jgi:uncharacterized protein